MSNRQYRHNQHHTAATTLFATQSIWINGFRIKKLHCVNWPLAY